MTYLKKYSLSLPKDCGLIIELVYLNVMVTQNINNETSTFIKLQTVEINKNIYNKPKILFAKTNKIINSNFSQTFWFK